jgi:hypothetical protein
LAMSMHLSLIRLQFKCLIQRPAQDLKRKKNECL